jgi:ABC-type sugar transport system ATPase subunit
MTTATWRVEATGVTKRFPGQLALDGVDLRVAPGEVTALVGENGAGKSTLIKVLAGELVPDEGEIRLDGRVANFHAPSDAVGTGLGFIHQVPALVGPASVTENIMLGTGYRYRTLGLVDWRRHHEEAAGALRAVGLAHVDPRRRLGSLPIAEQQLVALARLLYTKASVFVLDEVTAALTSVEVDRLFGILRELTKEHEASVIYVSHRLAEVFAIADSVTVLRNGRLVARRPTAELDTDSLTELIVGKEVGSGLDRADRAAPSRHSPRATALQARRLTGAVLRDVSFDLAKGEILGLAGLSGSGQTEVLLTLFGAEPLTAGTITLGARHLSLRHPADAIAAGIALVTEDRKVDGFAEKARIWETMVLPRLRHFSRGGLLPLARLRASAAERAERFDIRPSGVDHVMSSLSGGNQQKVLLARWLTEQTDVLLLDEPTHGVDIGAKAAVYELVRQAAASGMSVIVASSDTQELQTLCDRVILLDRGSVLGEVRGADLTSERILGYLLRRQPPGKGTS